MKTFITITILLVGTVCPTMAAQGRLPVFVPPANSVAISPGTDIQSVVNKHPEGTAFLLKAGMHRLQSVRPKDNMAFYGEVAKDGRLLTTLSGARALTQFTREGSLWVIAGQTDDIRRTAYTTGGQRKGMLNIEVGWEGTTFCQDVFVNNRLLRHVGGPGLRFYVTGPGIKGGKRSGYKKNDTDLSEFYFLDAEGKKRGIRSEFFDFSTPLTRIPDISGRKADLERIDADINLDFQPIGYTWPRLDDRFADTFASRHRTFLKVEKPGLHKFYLSSDDGARLWVDDKLLIDNDGLQSFEEVTPLPTTCKPGDGHYVMKEKSQAIALAAGMHEIRIEFFKNAGHDRLLEEKDTWYYDYHTDRIYIAEDPAGKSVEVSVLDCAFNGLGTIFKEGQEGEKVVRNVTIRNLIVEKYAGDERMGGIHAGTGWIVEGNEVRQNHGTGIAFNAKYNEPGVPPGIARHNYVHDNGSRGMAVHYWSYPKAIAAAARRKELKADTLEALIEGNEIAFNNRNHYSKGWDAAGIKICGGVSGCLVRNNYIHNNDCKGIWVDVLANGNIFENNVIEGNSSSGITVEVSLRNKVRNNTIGNNCLWPGYDNAEVYVQSCAFNEVSGNAIQVAKRSEVDRTQTGREREHDYAEASTGMSSAESHAIMIALGSRAKPPEGDPDHLHTDCYCHDNKVYGNRIVFLGSTGAAGVIASTPGWESNQFHGNIYHFAPGGEAKRFAWNSLNRRLTFEEFRQKGQEPGGSVHSVVTPIEFQWRRK